MTDDYHQIKNLITKNLQSLPTIYQNAYDLYLKRLEAIGQKCEVLTKKQIVATKGEKILADYKEKSKAPGFKPKASSKYDQLGLVNESHLKIVKKRNERGNKNLVDFTNSLQSWIGTISLRIKQTFGTNQTLSLKFIQVSSEINESLQGVQEQIQNEEYADCKKKIGYMTETKEI